MTNVTQDSASDILGRLSKPVFLAGWDKSAPNRLTLHVSQPKKKRALEIEARAALLRAGIEADCEVRALDSRRLQHARSLEEVLNCFAHDAVVFDPTASITRSRALLRCVEALRGDLGRLVQGVFLEPESRTLHVLCRGEELSFGGRLDESRMKQAEAQTAMTINNWRAMDPGAFEFSIRLSHSLPQMPLVPVDRASYVQAPRLVWRNRLQSGLLAGGIAALLGWALPSVSRAEGPAVSAINAKLSGEGGVADENGIGFVDGSLTLPMGHSFGFQGDFGEGQMRGRNVWGIGGQAFWRDPEKGLLSLFAANMERDYYNGQQGSADSDRLGGSAEMYLGRFTPSASVGGQFGNVSNGAFGILDLAWYPKDDLKFDVGAEIQPGTSLALVGVEYQLGAEALPGLCVFADTGISGLATQRDGYALAGFRYYFGPIKALIKRHREDDPPSLVGQLGGGQTFHDGTGQY